jgi:hypothetical protein
MLDSAAEFFLPRLRVGSQYLRAQLLAEGVSVRLSSGCIEGLVRDAFEAAEHSQTEAESAVAALRREIEWRAKFIRKWVHTDEKFIEERCKPVIKIATEFALPRPWSVKATSARDVSPAAGPRR